MKKMDVIIALVFLVFAAAVFGYNLTQREVGTMVEISKDGQVIQTVPLIENQVIDLADEEQWNQVEIHDGHVTMIDANCNDRLCVHTAPLTTVGRAIVCLPHRLSIVISGDQPDSELDGISE